ncbi:thermonuclease family protein [Oceanomicrobium pacificus]|uniref:Thermonuclease family protein n=1 Tax=Oceanomicrobium pacificus TaxID=2692916 RepID=A0A6B0U017_9RHOB|nr:thermonuclease family protein [Oceanomicrobium pacificus]MXU66842.1 thermonuclease family protein [Oceanomicrobium pacificus]
MRLSKPIARLVTFAALFLSTPAAATDLSGIARTIDGDTIRVGNVKVRFNGVAAPERKTRAGEMARLQMQKWIDGRHVTCELNGEVSYDRMIGTCYLDRTNLSAAIIAAGLARDCPRYSGGRYREYETSASRELPFPGYCRG